MKPKYVKKAGMYCKTTKTLNGNKEIFTQEWIDRKDVDGKKD